MIRSLSKITLLLYFALILIGCESDPMTPVGSRDTTMVTEDTRALYILNEGQFGRTNATLDVMLINRITTIIDSTDRKDTLVVFDTVYQSNRIPHLGDVGNDLEMINGKLYVVLNNSHEIVVIDPKTAQETARIAFPANAPNKITNIGNNRALVSQLYTTTVAVINLATNTIVDNLDIGRTSEDIGVINNKAFISADSQSLVIWDLAAGRVEKVLVMPFEPQQIIVDSANNQIVVACQGDWDDPAGSTNLVWVNASTGEIVKTEKVGMGTFAISRLIRGDQNTVFLLTGIEVRKITLSTRSISEPIIQGTYYYGGGYDPVTGHLYLGDPGTFSDDGRIDVYNAANGTLLKSYGAGIAPAQFAFYR